MTPYAIQGQQFMKYMPNNQKKDITHLVVKPSYSWQRRCVSINNHKWDSGYCVPMHAWALTTELPSVPPLRTPCSSCHFRELWWNAEWLRTYARSMPVGVQHTHTFHRTSTIRNLPESKYDPLRMSLVSCSLSPERTPVSAEFWILLLALLSANRSPTSRYECPL